MARKAPAFQFYADDWLAGTFGMPADQKGVYVDLLCLQWSRGKITDSEIAFLRLTAGAAVDSVLAAKFRQDGDGWRNPRLAEMQGLSEIRKAAGITGGKSSLRGPGQAYCARRATDCAIKLGCSKHAKSRRAQLATRAGCDVELLKVWNVSDMEDAEAVLHGFFAGKRLDGEWFDITLEELESPDLSLRLRNIGATTALPVSQNGAQNGAQKAPPPSPSPSPTPTPSSSPTPSPKLAAARADGQLDFSGLEGTGKIGEAARKLGRAIEKRKLTKLGADWVWAHAAIGELLKPGFIADTASKVMEWQISKPRAYIEKALREECEAVGVPLARAVAQVPPRPKKEEVA